MKLPASLPVSLLCGVTPLLWSGVLRAETATREQCVAWHEEAQLHRAEDRLLSAREKLLLCSDTACPGVIQRDCSSWYSEVEQEIPSVVVSAHKGDQDLTEVQVFVDGELRAPQLDGREIRLDPGPHTVRLEAPGEAPAVRTVLLNKGGKKREVDFTFAVPVQPRPEPAPAPALQVEMERPVPLLTYILLGVSGGGLSSGVILGALGTGEFDSLQADCAPFCTDEQKSGVDTLFLVSDVSYGVAAAAGVGALVTWLVRPSVPVPVAPKAAPDSTGSLGVRVLPSPRGAAVVFGGSF